MQPCDHPTVEVGPRGATNADLTKGLTLYKAVLTACNIDKALLRDWVDSMGLSQGQK